MSRLDRPTDLSTDLTDLMPAPPARRMSEEEFVAWCDEAVRAEWVDGEVVVMSPASFDHGRLVQFVSRVLLAFVEAHTLGVVPGPDFTVRLPNQRRRRVPDLMFISGDRSYLIENNHLEGPPDVAFEIVSPDSVARDWREKYHEYESAGVREYWIIDPMAERVEAYALGGEGKYERIAESEGRIGSVTLAGFFLRPAWLWQQPLPPVREVLTEIGVR